MKTWTLSLNFYGQFLALVEDQEVVGKRDVNGVERSVYSLSSLGFMPSG